MVQRMQRRNLPLWMMNERNYSSFRRQKVTYIRYCIIEFLPIEQSAQLSTAEATFQWPEAGAPENDRQLTCRMGRVLEPRRRRK